MDGLFIYRVHYHLPSTPLLPAIVRMQIDSMRTGTFSVSLTPVFLHLEPSLAHGQFSIKY